MKKYLQSLIVVIAVIAMVMVLVGPAAVQADDPLPDLIGGGSFCIVSATASTTTISYSHWVRNIGNADVTQPFDVFMTSAMTPIQSGGIGVFGLAVKQVTVNSLSKGQTRSIWSQSFTWQTPLNQIQSASFTTDVDVNHTITEQSETNNHAGIAAYPGWCPGHQPAHIAGYIFDDTNGNGRRDNGEGMLKNSVVQLWHGGHYVTQVSPGFPSGHFEINPQPGNYVLTGVLPDSSWHWTTKHQYGVNYNGSNGGTYLFGGAKGKATPPPQPTPTPPPCNPPGTYNVVSPPSLGIGDVTPAFPMVTGQGGTGFTLPITAQGGWAEQRHKVPEKKNGKWVCVEKTLHHYDDHVGQIARTVDLSAKSQQWIEQVLASYYWGATVQGYYPDNLVLFSGSKDTLNMPLTYDALDPGQYKVNVVLTTRGTPISAPQQAHAKANVSVYLLTNTLWR